jgi:N-acetylneuraminic acid mutarotase
MPTAREWPGASVVNGKIYVIGGRNDSTIFAANEEYDPAINTWTGKASMHTARLVFATAVVNNKIYAIGGGNSSTLLSNNEEYDPVTSSWTDRAGMPAARWGNRAAEVGNKVYVIGGNLDPMPIVGPSTLGIPTNEEFTLELLYVHKKD